EAVTAAELQVDGDGDEAAADQPEPDRPAHGEQSLADEVGVPGGHSTRQREDAGTQRDAAAERGASARITVGPAVIPVDRETSSGRGSFHIGSPSHCAAASVASNVNPSVSAARFIVPSQRQGEPCGTRAHGPGGDGATVGTAARLVNPVSL